MSTETTRRPTAVLSDLRPGSWQERSWSLVRDWWGLPLVGLLALIGALIYVGAPDGVSPIFDDAFISLTFARNLAEHGKLSFDGETWSTGATSPLHVVLLAVLIKLGVEPVWAGVALGVFFQVVLAGGVYLLAWALFRTRLAAILAGAAVAFTGYTALDSGNGLETSLFLALITLAVASFFLATDIRGRLLTGGLIGLCVLTRPEGVFLIPACLLYRWLARAPDEARRGLINEAVAMSAPGVIAAGCIALYSLIVADTLGGTATAKMAFFRENEWSLIDKVTFASNEFSLFVAPLWGFILFAAFAAKKQEMLLFAFFLTPLFLLHSYYFPGGLHHYFLRYQHPALPFLAVMAGGGAAYLVQQLLTRELVIKALVVALFAVALVPVEQQFERWRVIYRDASNETHTLLQSMGQDLNTIIQPNEVLATHDIGAVGYYGKFRVLDLVGLVNPQVIDYHEGRRLRQYMEGARPDYLLFFPIWDFDFLQIFPGNEPERYKVVKVYQGGIVRTEPYVLYKIDWSVGE